MQVECPSCKKTLNAPDERAGQIVKCPACGGEMQLPAAAVPAAPSPYASGLPAPSTSGPTKSCPYCGEKILAAAQKCRFCQTMLAGPGLGRSTLPGRNAPAASSNEATAALICGIIGTVTMCFPVLPLALGIAALVLAKKARQKGRTDGMTTAGMVLGILALVFGSLMMLYWLVVITAAIASG